MPAPQFRRRRNFARTPGPRRRRPRHRGPRSEPDALARNDEPRVDLAAQLWHQHTGLPFVFAVWAARRSASAELTEVLKASYHVSAEARMGEIEEVHRESSACPREVPHLPSAVTSLPPRP